MSRVSEFLSGASNAVQDHVDGLRQIAGAEVDTSGRESRTTAESIGAAVGESALFLASTLLAKKIPGAGKLCEGKLAGIVAGGMLGFTQSVDQSAPGAQRTFNTLLGAGTMGILEFGPVAAGHLPGVFSSQKTLAGNVARAALANGAAGLFNIQGQSYVKTGHPASFDESLAATGTWMLTGSALSAAGFKLDGYRQKLDAARRWQEERPWKYKQVIELNASDLQVGERLSPGSYRIGYESQGAGRTFDIYISDGAAAAKKAPLTAFLHGLSRNGESTSIVRELEFNRLADESAAIVAYPHARAVQRGLFRGIFQAWNDKNFGFLRHDNSYSDVVAFKDMLGVISRHVPYADTSNIAVGGFSLGGKMAHRIAAHLDNVSTLSTIHSTIDLFDKKAIKMAAERHPLDVQIIHGRKDTVLPFAGGKSLFTAFLANSNLSRPSQQAEFWAASNRQLSASSTYSDGGQRSFSTATHDRGTFRQRSFKSSNGYQVEELVTADGAHRVHGAESVYDLTQVLTGRPLPAWRFDARLEMWRFLMDSLKRNESRVQPFAAPSVVASRGGAWRNADRLDGEILDFGRRSGGLLDERFADIYRAAHRSIGRVTSEASTSTGFVVSKDGAFLVTDHAVADGQSTVSLPSGIYKAILLARQRRSDLALLKLEPNHPDELFSPLKIAEIPARLGEKSLAAGFPVVSELVPPYRAMTGRLFTHNSEFGDSIVHEGTRWDGYFMRTAGGASGSPVMNRNGAVTGIVSFNRRFGDGPMQVHTTGAIGAPTLLRFLSENVSV